VALLKFVAVCRAAVHATMVPGVQQSIVISRTEQNSYPAGQQQQTNSMLLLLQVTGTDRRTPYHYINPAPDTMNAFRAVTMMAKNLRY